MSYSNELDRSLSHTVERFGAALTLSQWSGFSFGSGHPSFPKGTCCAPSEEGGGGGAALPLPLQSGGGHGGGGGGGGAEDGNGDLLSTVDELRDLDS